MTRHRALRTATAGVSIVLLATCGGPQSAPSDGRPGSAAGTHTVPAPPVPATSLAADPDGVLPTTAATADPAAVSAAVEFTRAWARPDLPTDRWLAGVRPYAIPAYAELLTTVQPTNVPATRVTGLGRAVAATADRVDVDVTTDAGVLRVVCVRSSGRWLVATLGMREEAAAR
ncbi:hypothetical protein JNW90_01715 [Micromonospora sp. STR1s_5]|nr:hypothetical protein [Micromonospora sp. STR1s_5]